MRCMHMHAHAHAYIYINLIFRFRRSGSCAAAAEHQSECQFALIACPYSVYGCLTRVSRRHLDAHLVGAAVSHLALADACVRDLAGILVAMNKSRRKPIGLHPLAVPDLRHVSGATVI
jgi:hypothetical protein